MGAGAAVCVFVRPRGNSVLGKVKFKYRGWPECDPPFRGRHLNSAGALLRGSGETGAAEPSSVTGAAAETLPRLPSARVMETGPQAL